MQLDYLKAKTCLAGEEYQEAQKVLSELVEKYEDIEELNYSYHLCIGYCRYKQKKYKEALALFQRQVGRVEGGQRAALAYFYSGLALLKLRRYIDAVQPLIQAVSLDSSSPLPTASLFFFYLGKAQYKIKLYERAILSLTEAIGKKVSSRFKFHRVFLSRGKCYLELGNLHAAKEDFLQALILQKNNAQTLYALAMLEYIKYMRLGNSQDLDAAAHYADNLLFKSPSHLKSLILIGLILVKNGSYEQALKSFGLAISLNSQNNRRARIFRLNCAAFLQALRGEGKAEDILKELNLMILEC